MSNILKGVAFLVALVAIIISPWIKEYIDFAGLTKGIQPLNTSRCKLVETAILQGCKQIRIHRSSRKAYLACVSSTQGIRKNPGGGGRVVLFDLKTEKFIALHLLPANAKEPLNPMGIGIITDPNNSSIVLIGIVNQLPNGSVIDIIQHVVGSRNATRLSRYRSEALLPAPSDIVLINRDTFYVTNYLKHNLGWKRLVEIMTRRPWSFIVKHTPESGFTVVAEDIRMANGIALASTSDELYVVSSLTPSLLRYQIKAGRDRLRLLESIPLPFAGDKVSVDFESGAIYVAGHPKLLNWLAHTQPGSSTLSPSAVVKIEKNRGSDLFYGKRWNESTLFVDDGSLLSGSSVFVYDSGVCPISLISGARSGGILVCSDLN